MPRLGKKVSPSCYLMWCQGYYCQDVYIIPNMETPIMYRSYKKKIEGWMVYTKTVFNRKLFRTWHDVCLYVKRFQIKATHHRHFCSRDTGTSRHCRGLRRSRDRRAGSRVGPTSCLAPCSRPVRSPVCTSGVRLPPFVHKPPTRAESMIW